jgi:hypothetical protein
MSTNSRGVERSKHGLVAVWGEKKKGDENFTLKIKRLN